MWRVKWKQLKATTFAFAIDFYVDWFKPHVTLKIFILEYDSSHCTRTFTLGCIN